MKRALLGMVAVSMMGISGSAALADSTFLAPPDGDTSPTPPGWYDGSGNPNGGFTIATSTPNVVSPDGIELGLRAKERQSPSVINPVNVGGVSTYYVNPGAEPGAPSYAYWNYEFSIDLQPNGSGSLTLSDITATLAITDLTTGTSATVDALNYWPDDSGWGSSGKTTTLSAGDWGAQNSENPIFTGLTGFPLDGLPEGAGTYQYNENAADDYSFTLTVDEGGVQLATDTIDVDVTPLPSSALAGIALLGTCGALALKKRFSGQVA